MIKIFGKIRYHWQPDLTSAIIYWSFTFTILFLSVVVTLEKTHIYWLSFFIFALFLVLVVIGFHRYFYFNKYGDIEIVSLLESERGHVRVSEITKLEIFPKGIVLYEEHFPFGRVFYMRKWHKEPFLEELKAHLEFHAEVVENHDFLK